MKYSDPTYYLLVALCLIITSCNAETDDFPENKGQAWVTDARINFVLNFPASSSTRASEGYETESERTIDDIHVYTFQDDRFIEEIQYLMIDGKDGDVSRNIDGKLSGTYVSGAPMDFVVIANAGNKGVPRAEMAEGDSKAALYRQLSFDYEGKDWSKNIPMWGEGTIGSLKSEDNNFGALDLVRAVAKVNVTVAGGAGLENFEITEIRLYRYNTKGYCAPTGESGNPSIPPGSEIASGYLTSGALSGNQGNLFENKFYIAEHQNKGTAEDKKVYLSITAKVRDVEKNYTVPFSEGKNPYDVLRNHIYVFNITSVDKVTAALTYEVKQWENIDVDVPSFD